MRFRMARFIGAAIVVTGFCLELSVETLAQESVESLEQGEKSQQLKFAFEESRTFYQQGDYVNAKLATERAIGLAIAELGEFHRDVDKLYQNLALMNKKQGNLEKAEEIYTNVLKKKIVRENQPGQPLSIAITMGNLANLYNEQDRNLDAENFYLEAIKIIKKEHGETHAELINNYNNLGDLYRKQGRFDEAQKLLDQAIAVDEEISGPNSRDLVVPLLNLNALYIDMGRTEEANLVRERINRIMSGQP